MEFYVYLNGTRRGPLTAAQVGEYLATGLLQFDDLAAGTREGELRALSRFAQFGAATTPEIAAIAPAAAEPPSPAPVRPVTPPSPGMRPLPRETLGPYARATLAPNETAFYRTSLHWIVFVRFGLLTLLVFLLLAMPFAIGVQILTGSEIGWFALPLPVFIMVPPTLAYVSSELVITNMRVLIKSGIVRRETLEMFISKVESVAVDQGMLGRILDYGTVSIRGTGGSQEPFEAIAHPLDFRNSLQRLQSGEPHTARTAATS